MTRPGLSTLLVSNIVVVSVLSACTSSIPSLPPAAFTSLQNGVSEEYIIGPDDELSIHVWRNPELGADKIQVRPDGRITTPLVTDLPAAGKTPTMLAQDIRLHLSQFIEEPLVSVIVNRANSTYNQQVRIVGSTGKPASISYRANMTVLDAMIAVGGLGQFAAGNKSKLVRLDKRRGRQMEYRLRLKDLLVKGDTSANALLQPGDVIIIPESMF